MSFQSQLARYFSNYASLSQEENALIYSLCQVQTRKQGSYLLEEEAYATELYFIVEGFVGLTAYRQEFPVVTDIVGPYKFTSDFDSFIQGIPASNSIKCLTSCTYLLFTKADYLSLIERIPIWNKVREGIYEGIISEQIKRTNEILTLSAKERYLKLMTDSPELVQQVPIQYLASYLGIRPESLSRIRGTLNS